MKLRFTTSHTKIEKKISKNSKLCKITFSFVVFIEIRKFVSEKCEREKCEKS